MVPLQPLKAVIEEQFIQSKTGNIEDCEDTLYTGEHYVSIIDGATAKSERRWEGETGGRRAASIISQAFNEIPPDCSARQAADLITGLIHKCYTRFNLLETVRKDPDQRIIASCATISLTRQEVWLIGDCHLLLGNQYISHPKKIDHTLSEVRALVLELEMVKGMTVEQLRKKDKGRDYIMPLLKEHTLMQNNPAASPYWFPALDGFTIPDAGILTLPIPKDVETIVLATDGYPVVKDSLKESEHILEKTLTKDPLMFRSFKSTKGMGSGNLSFDDRAYIKVRLNRSLNCPETL
jgi:glycerophosphoryl diester phosphodiesterase